MPFNSNTYYANQNAKLAWQNLARARALRARLRAGGASDLEHWQLPRYVERARFDMHRALFFRRMNRSA